MNNCFFMIVLIFIILVFLLTKTSFEPFANIKESDYEKIKEFSKVLLRSVGLDESLGDDLTKSIIKDDFKYILSKVNSEDKEKIQTLFISINKELLKKLYINQKKIY